MNVLQRFAAGAVLLCAAGVGQAHKLSDSYLTLRLADRGGTFSGQWDIALRDLDYAIGIDSNHDGEITWGELEGRGAANHRLRIWTTDSGIDRAR